MEEEKEKRNLTLKAEIVKSGKSQQEVAKLVGIHPSTLSLIIVRRMVPHLHEKKALAKLLKKPIGYLFDEWCSTILVESSRGCCFCQCQPTHDLELDLTRTSFLKGRRHYLDLQGCNQRLYRGQARNIKGRWTHGALFKREEIEMKLICHALPGPQDFAPGLRVIVKAWLRLEVSWNLTCQ